MINISTYILITLFLLLTFVLCQYSNSVLPEMWLNLMTSFIFILFFLYFMRGGGRKKRFYWIKHLEIYVIILMKEKKKKIFTFKKLNTFEKYIKMYHNDLFWWEKVCCHNWLCVMPTGCAITELYNWDILVD